MKKLAALCFVALIGPGCSNGDVSTEFNPTTSLRLESDGAGRVCNSDGDCFDDPCGCDAVTVDIDDASGESRETCLLADGTANDACGDVVACVAVTIPDPDCHVCAWVDGAVVYSSCIVEEEIRCEYYHFDGTSAGGISGSGEPDSSNGERPTSDPTDPPERCEPGSSFPAGDGCNTCECDADGNVFCTERFCDGCRPGETFRADDGCNTCTCGEDGVIRCTEMACGGSCKVCYDPRGNVVVDECRNDCSTAVCPAIDCAPGFELRRLDGDCCGTCVPVDDCSTVRCDMTGLVDCPEGWRPERVPGSCCDYRCEPGDCSDVACPDVAIDCPEGYALVAGDAPNCCPRCEPVRTRCTSSRDCAPNEVCSVTDGDCDAACEAGDDNCIAVCAGYCKPTDQCLRDFVCPDGSLPQGEECRCANTDECLLDFVCADGSLPQGAECRCADECLLDFICPDGSAPQGADCRCANSDECLMDFVCADGSLPQGADCRCADECRLDFICRDGSQPQGAECRCPDTACYSDLDCSDDAYCTTSDGVCNAPPGCDATNATCPAVCTGTCAIK